ncbi:MAG: hypothetical protein UV09_C0008G0026 [Candidatus Gottesmanbacteria bacterium GW2011_GWA2_42_18]|uniref:Uncharacterized protein n=1 Tax=Candidatus Gottesmanbacteria bacterium GW2011_GWA2_42_18 TaxID=1618442 RepID=A0A0G0ZEK2_9BACT|nr:MAG: hypothetical protein UV09_C0008G0026 [Candidatus Gottesmanbacteria bacterium GW2011_GWA2_42_18]
MTDLIILIFAFINPFMAKKGIAHTAKSISSGFAFTDRRIYRLRTDIRRQYSHPFNHSVISGQSLASFWPFSSSFLPGWTDEADLS